MTNRESTILSSPTAEPTIPLNIIVIGGSIAGVASAYALQKAGHDVLVIEQTDGKYRSNGGLRAPPNMTKILHQWGLEPVLAQRARRCDKFVFRSGDSGDMIASMLMGEDFLRDVAADFMFIQHGDLYDMLYDLASKEGVAFRFDSTVKEVDSDSMLVKLETGDELVADIIVGADGIKSVVRPCVDDEDYSSSKERESFFAFTVPGEVMEKDEDLRPLLKTADWNVWLGDGYLFHGNPSGSGNNYCVALAYRFDENSPPDTTSQWIDPPSLDQTNLNPNRFATRLRKLVKAGRPAYARLDTPRRPLDSLVCDNGRIVLVGEAAHPLLPVGHYGMALGIEDAHTLGLLLSQVRSRDQVSQLLIAYEDIRQPRCSTVHEMDYDSRTMFVCPPGPVQQQRDSTLREAMAVEDLDHMDEATFKAIWGDELALLAYDATDTVEDWWTKWGSMLKRQSISGNMVNEFSGQGNGVSVMPNVAVMVSQRDSPERSMG
ncbi:hypothetical protein BDQ17DRAFT_1431283 [Cyathus striatus]|nr:hypothetical protein BDQ17DRAFT_1431283 [Cyathus striatus]